MDIGTDPAFVPAVENLDGRADAGLVDGPGDRLDDDLVEAEYTRRRPGWVTFALAAAIIAGLGFTGGALVQRSSGTTSAAVPGGMRSQAMPSGAGMPGGEGFPGVAGGMPGAASGGQSADQAASQAAGQAAGQSTAGSGTTAGSSSASATPVVVGTVTALGTGTLTVKNLGGTSVAVKAGSRVPVTVYGLGGSLKVGMLVAVIGSKAADGSVTATSITARAA